jgi:hypothetical protein
MWNKRSFLLYIRIRLRGIKPRIRLLTPLALFVCHQLLLAWGALLALIPGRFGQKARLTADIIHGMLLQLMYAKPQKIADINIRNKEHGVRVVVRTVGLSEGDGL